MPSAFLHFIAPLLAISILVTACQDEELALRPSPTTEGQRTVLVYMAAQNSLGRENAHLSDSTEIMNGRSAIPSECRLLLFIDDAARPRLYRIEPDADSPKLIHKWDTDVNSTDPAVLTDVLQRAKADSPAKEYGLVMWSHADGWLPATEEAQTTYSAFIRPFSFGIDSGENGNMSDNGTQMNLDDMNAAIKEADMHCLYIFFDACLMQNLETAYELRETTDYIVASPISTPATGAYYTNLIKNGLFSTDPADIARTYLADVQDKSLSSMYDDFGLAISCLRTDKLSQLAELIKESLPYSAAAGHASPDLSDVLNYQAYSYRYYYRPHQYDALQALLKIMPSSVLPEIQAALDEVITYHGATAKFWIGPGYNTFQTVDLAADDYRAVSMFVPQAVYTTNASLTPHGDLNEAFRTTAWYQDAGWAATGW